MTDRGGYEAPLTVGQLRAAMAGASDDAQVFVNVLGQSPDFPIYAAWESRQIPWDHDCDESDDPDHKPGIDCPTVWGVEIHAQQIEGCPGCKDVGKLILPCTLCGRVT